MKKPICALVLAISLWSVGAATAGAHHDMVYAPCDPEDTRSFDERVWYIDYQSGDMLRWDDPWWSERPGLAGYTNWHHQCRLGMTGVWQAAPILPLPHPPTHTTESRDVIRATTTTTTISPAPSTTQPPPTTTEGTSAPSDQPETTVPAPTTTHPPSTTTTQVPASTTVAPATTTTTTMVPLDGGWESHGEDGSVVQLWSPCVQGCLELVGESYKLPDGYDLHTAQYDGWPFKKTIILLELRYPPGTPGKTHFPFSVAQHFLKQGGTVGGLDFLWNSNG